MLVNVSITTVKVHGSQYSPIKGLSTVMNLPPNSQKSSQIVQDSKVMNQISH